MMATATHIRHHRTVAAEAFAIVTGADESALFAALGLEYLTPQQREAFA